LLELLGQHLIEYSHVVEKKFIEPAHAKISGKIYFRNHIANPII